MLLSIDIGIGIGLAVAGLHVGAVGLILMAVRNIDLTDWL